MGPACHHWLSYCADPRVPSSTQAPDFLGGCFRPDVLKRNNGFVGHGGGKTQDTKMRRHDEMVRALRWGGARLHVSRPSVVLNEQTSERWQQRTGTPSFLPCLLDPEVHFHSISIVVRV